MVTPKLVYEQRRDYLLLRVTNLTQLSVAQIQELEQFAAARRGWFDFNTSQIHIEKRLELEQLSKLLDSVGITASVEEKEEAVEAPKCNVNAKIGFGKYRGHAYSEIPDAYMMWLKGNYYGPERQEVDNELARRGL